MFDISGQLICMGASRTYVVNSGSLITEFVGASIIGIPSVESTQVKLQEQLVPMISIWVSWAMTPMFTTLKRRKPHRIGSLICRTIKIASQNQNILGGKSVQQGKKVMPYLLPKVHVRRNACVLINVDQIDATIVSMNA